MKIASTKERILEYTDFKGISKSEFYKKNELKRGLLDSDKLNQSISDIFLAKIIANNPDINPIWLLTGKGNMLLEEPMPLVQEPQLAYNTFKLRADQSQENQVIPLYNIEAAAGLVELFQSSSSHIPIDTLRIPNLPKM